MKISSINTYKLQNTTRFKKQKIAKFDYSRDVFVKEQAKTPSDEFRKIVKNRELAAEIANNLFIAKDGRYLESIEQEFLDWLEGYQNAYTVSTGKELDSKQKEYMIKLMYSIFLASKKDGEVDIDYQKMSEIFDIVVGRISKKDDKLIELIKQSKTKDGIDPSMLEGLIEYDRFYNGQRTPSQMKFFIVNNCLDSDGKFSLSRFRAFIFLTGLIKTDNYDVIDRLKNAILDKDGQIVLDKYNFVCGVLKVLSDNISEEFPEEQINESAPYIRSAKLQILEKLINSTTDNSGDYDPIKAANAFDEWFEYAYCHENEVNSSISFNLMDSGKVKKISLAQALNDPDVYMVENFLGYNTTIYRLLRVLSGESVFKG